MVMMKSIQGRIAMVAGACLLGSAVALVGYGVVSAKSTQNLVAGRVGELVQKDNAESLKNLAWGHAGVIQAKFDLALDAARTMAHTFELAKDGSNSLNLGRNQINAILKSVLDKNPEFNGTYSNWEPNTLDGRDVLLIFAPAIMATTPRPGVSHRTGTVARVARLQFSPWLNMTRWTSTRTVS